MNIAQQCSLKKISISKTVYRNHNQMYMLILEWSFMVSNALIVTSFAESNPRFIIYIILFFLSDSIKSTQKITQIEDPLHLSYSLTLSKYLKIIMNINMVYLLIRIICHSQNITSFFLIVHFAINYYYSQHSKDSILDIGTQQISFPKIVNPFFLYILGKTLHGFITDISLMFLLIVCANCFLATECRYLANLSQTVIRRWSLANQKHHSEDTWNRRDAIKGVMVSACAVLLIENILLAVDSIRDQISLGIIQTLIIGIVALIMYTLPSKI